MTESRAEQRSFSLMRSGGHKLRAKRVRVFDDEPSAWGIVGHRLQPNRLRE